MSEMSPDVAGHMAVILKANTEAIEHLLADRGALVRYVRALILYRELEDLGRLEEADEAWKEVQKARQALSQELKDEINK